MPRKKRKKTLIAHRTKDASHAYFVSFLDINDHFVEKYPWIVDLNPRRPALRYYHHERNDPDLTKLLEWCADNFGLSDYFSPYAKNPDADPKEQRNYIRLTTRMRWNHLGWFFFFKTQEDATLFKVMHY